MNYDKNVKFKGNLLIFLQFSLICNEKQACINQVNSDLTGNELFLAV